jgi:hypothetical protein
MSSTSNSKYSKNFCVPYFWSKERDLSELKDYFSNLRGSQVILKTLQLNQLEEEESTLVKEIFTRRGKLVEYIYFISDNYTFKNETSFKAVQLFDHYLHKLLVKYFSSDNSPDNSASQDFITQLFAEFVNYMTVYAIIFLNIACKVEEINCNYLSFFNENLLKKKYSFTNEELNKKETGVLKFLNFRTHMPTSFQFSSIFFQIIIQHIFSIETNTEWEKLNIKLLTKNSQISKIYTTFNESMYNSPLTTSLICFKASIITLSHSHRVDLTVIHEKFNDVILDFLRNQDYLKKIEQEAHKVFSKYVQMQKV